MESLFHTFCVDRQKLWCHNEIYINPMFKSLSIFEREKSNLQVEWCTYDVQRNCTNVTAVEAQKGVIEHRFETWKLLRVLQKQKVHNGGGKDSRKNALGVTESVESKVELAKCISDNQCMFEARIPQSHAILVFAVRYTDSRTGTGVVQRTGLITFKDTLEQRYVITEKYMR